MIRRDQVRARILEMIAKADAEIQRSLKAIKPMDKAGLRGRKVIRRPGTRKRTEPWPYWDAEL